MRKILAVLVVLWSATTWAQTTRHPLVANGESRTYYLHVPPGLSVKAPLVIALHGGGGDGLQMERSTRFSDLADKEMFVVAYPDGLDRQWNDGRAEVGSTSDDVGFIKAMIADIQKQGQIDGKRIYVTGMSNGAAMTSRIGCEMSDSVLAIGPVSNTMNAAMLATCKPVRPVAVIEIHGVDDPVVPFAGGEIHVLGRKRGRVISTRQYSEFWAKHDGCNETAETTDVKSVVDDGTSVLKNEFQHCDAPVVFYAIRGGGHSWPGGVQHLRMLNVGRMSHQIDATKLIWDFFKEQLPAPEPQKPAAKPTKKKSFFGK